MLLVGGPTLARHEVEFEEIAPCVWRTRKRPLFQPDYNHFSYILVHPDGLILYDAPPLVTPQAIETIRGLGKPRLLIVSHQDFVGFAGDWAEALGIPAWMGEGDTPLPGNRFSPDEHVGEARQLFDDLEVVPVPGHSPGSLAVYWSGAPAGPVLCCGDALTVWHHEDGKIQLAFFQDPPVGPAIKALTARPISLLAACTGILEDAAGPLQQLHQADEPCAKPWRGDKGGVWLESVR
jgi:glyoxylase-like metal-dependent hydrolase (beta-lactamase superfamily II)